MFGFGTSGFGIGSGSTQEQFDMKRKTKSVKDLRTVLKQDPRWPARPTNYGCDFPITIACRYGAPDEVIEILINIAPGAAFCEGSMGYTPFEYFCNSRRRNWDGYMMFLQVHYETHGSTNLKGGSRTLFRPLHTAVSNWCRFRPFLDIALQHDSDNLRVQDENGDLPLHIICRDRPWTKDQVLKVLNAYPEAAGIRNKQGKLPLQILGFENCSRFMELYQPFMEAAPHAAGEHPYFLVYAAGKYTSSDDIKLDTIYHLLRLNPSQVDTKNLDVLMRDEYWAKPKA